MKPLSLVFLAGSLALAACGNSKPSLSDARKEIENIFYSAFANCSQIKVDDFEKLNGLPNGERYYTLQVRYVMKVIPPSANARIAEDYVARKTSNPSQVSESEVLGPLKSNFDSGCRAPLDQILLRNDIVHNRRDFPNGVVDFYSRGFIKTYQEDVRMVLTENGWKIAR